MRARLEAVATWGKVSFCQKMSPTKVIFSTKVVYFVDLDLALDIVKQMTIQEKQKKYTREKGIQEKKDMNVK